MNDRPLTYVYSHNNSEGQSLSPSMLTLGYNLLEPPHLRMSHKKDAVAKKYGEQFVLLEQVKNFFWEKWSSEYLAELFEKHVKANKPRPGFPVPKIGDVCLLKNENLPRRKWGLCRVLGFKTPKRDGHIRECRVQRLTKKGKVKILKRSPQYLVPLEIDPHYIDDDPLVKIFADQGHRLAPVDSDRSIASPEISAVSLEEGETVSDSLEVSGLPDSDQSIVSSEISVVSSEESEAISDILDVSGLLDSAVLPDLHLSSESDQSFPSESVADVVHMFSGPRRSKRVQSKSNGKSSGFEVSESRCPVSGSHLGEVVRIVAQPRRSNRLCSKVLGKTSVGASGRVVKSKRLAIRGAKSCVSTKPAASSKLAVPVSAKVKKKSKTGACLPKRSKKGVCLPSTNHVSAYSRSLRPRSKTLGLVINPNI